MFFLRWSSDRQIIYLYDLRHLSSSGGYNSGNSLCLGSSISSPPTKVSGIISHIGNLAKAQKIGGLRISIFVYGIENFEI